VTLAQDATELCNCTDAHEEGKGCGRVEFLRVNTRCRAMFAGVALAGITEPAAQGSVLHRRKPVE
jgi:hypothetical protein